MPRTQPTPPSRARCARGRARASRSSRPGSAPPEQPRHRGPPTPPPPAPTRNFEGPSRSPAGAAPSRASCSRWDRASSPGWSAATGSSSRRRSRSPWTATSPRPAAPGAPTTSTPTCTVSLELAARKSPAARSRVIARRTLSCRQRLPNRQHHCPVVLRPHHQDRRPLPVPARPLLCERRRLAPRAHWRAATSG